MVALIVGDKDRDGASMAFWYDELPEGYKEGDIVEIFGHRCILRDRKNQPETFHVTRGKDV